MRPRVYAAGLALCLALFAASAHAGEEGPQEHPPGVKATLEYIDSVLKGCAFYAREAIDNTGYVNVAVVGPMALEAFKRCMDTVKSRLEPNIEWW